MPTYDYVCESCGHRLEVVHSIHGHGPSECPSCGGPLKKAFSAPAIHFKGTGWARKEGSGKGHSSRSKESDASDSTGPTTPAATEPTSAKPDTTA